MPLLGITADTWGQAWRQIVTDVISLIGNGQIKTYALSLIPPYQATPGGLNFTLTQGEFTYTAKYLITQWLPTVTPPAIGQIIRDPLFSAFISAAFGDGEPNAQQLVPILYDARGKILRSAPLLNPFKAGVAIISGFASAFDPRAVIYNRIEQFVTQNDACTDVMTVHDTSQSPIQVAQPQPPGPTYHPQVTQSGQPIVTVEIPQIQDVSLNRGQSLYTVQSRTFTNPGSAAK